MKASKARKKWGHVKHAKNVKYVRHVKKWRHVAHEHIGHVGK